MTVLTKETELLRKLEDLYEAAKRPGRDIEGLHLDADEALLDYIGDAEIRAAYERIPRWYA